VVVLEALETNVYGPSMASNLGERLIVRTAPAAWSSKSSGCSVTPTYPRPRPTSVSPAKDSKRLPWRMPHVVSGHRRRAREGEWDS